MPTRRTCATMPQHRHLAAVSEPYRARRREIEAFTALVRRRPRTTPAKIPVVVHVLYRTNAENISEAQVDSQIDVLNADFRARNADRDRVPEEFAGAVGDSLVEFELASEDPGGKRTSGITRTKTAVKAFDGDIEALDDAIKVASGAVAWPADRYLNVWVCTLGSGLLGYAQFPGGPDKTDGIVVLNTAFGTRGIAEAPFDLGRTATHEIGHWLNLLHVWGDDDLGCRGSDNVADTPNQGGANTGCPTFPRVSCRNAPDGDMFMNFMDYTDDACMHLFTKGQVGRMHAALAGPRAKIVGEEPQATPAVRLGMAATDIRAIRGALGREAGIEAELVFDGVGWVPPR